MDANEENFLYGEIAALVSFIACASFGLAPALLSARGNLEVVGTVLRLEYVVLMFATRNAGTPLVGDVLALEAATSGKKEHTTIAKPRFSKASKMGSKSFTEPT